MGSLIFLRQNFIKVGKLFKTLVLVLWYFNQNYNHDSINMSLIFDYIFNLILEDLFSFAEIDELITTSRFAKSMSSDDVFDILATSPI